MSERLVKVFVRLWFSESSSQDVLNGRMVQNNRLSSVALANLLLASSAAPLSGKGACFVIGLTLLAYLVAFVLPQSPNGKRVRSSIWRFKWVEDEGQRQK